MEISPFLIWVLTGMFREADLGKMHPSLPDHRTSRHKYNVAASALHPQFTQCFEPWGLAHAGSLAEMEAV